ncbi:hypothetical protein [Vibrio sp. F13]|uniref:hypothetical protein n=1 Tax=Vibrio sp. F13 TaxID=2070777 RepID=UPI0010BD6240|nr:hypothetical protein [Vibrio sp. F13]TKG02339.1 hypothetical protein FCV67_21260 [Vibrio sp. F13]
MNTFTAKEFKQYLENAPLYKTVKYTKLSGGGDKYRIDEVDGFCDKCETMRPFHDMRSRGAGAGSAISAPPKELLRNYSFKCVSCRSETKDYFVRQTIKDDIVTFEKVGETPRPKLERDKQLEKFFANDSDNYQKAIVCLANGYGIAAFAYMRRIVEQNIETLLNLLSEDTSSSDDQEITQALSELKRESPMSDKIKVANKALPDYLKPDGLNPLGKLYQILSEGVHSMSDSECLERATSLKACIKYLVSELASRKANREKFKSLVGSM